MRGTDGGGMDAAGSGVDGTETRRLVDAWGCCMVQSDR